MRGSRKVGGSARTFGRGFPLSRRLANYTALAGEFYILAELALQGLDGTLTLGHTKEIDVLVRNRETKQTFQLEVKTTAKGVQRSEIFGLHYGWLMHERHGHVSNDNLLYAFVLLEEGNKKKRKPRFFFVPSGDVAAYIRWEYRTWRRHSTRQTGKLSSMREFRIPIGDVSRKKLPPFWRDGRWQRYEDNWRIFGRSPVGSLTQRRRPSRASS